MNYKTDFKQSPLTPQPYIFKIVWTIITILFTIAVYNLFTKPILIKSIIILILCVLWTTIFFKYKNSKLSFVILLLLILSVINISIDFYNKSKLYGYLQIPFISWLFVALYFNYYIIMNN